MIYETTRTKNETIEFVSWVERLHSVEQTRDDIMSTRSLTTAEDDTYVERLERFLFTCFELNDRHAVSVREQCLDFFLIANRLSWLTFFCNNRT